MHIEITFEDGTTRRDEIRPADLVAFERQYDVDWASVEASPKMEHSLYLAYASESRTGTLEPADATFDDWLAKVSEIEDGDAPDPSEPSEEAASGDS